MAKKGIVLLFASLSLVFAQEPIEALAQKDCAAVTCLVGSTCVNGQCIPSDDFSQAKKIKDPCFPKVSSPAGCIQSCKDDKFDDCKDRVFPAIFDPKFCGYNKKTGQWINYTFACQACVNSDIVGFANQKCNCSFTGCKINENCNLNTGQCQPIKTQPTCSNVVPKKVECKQRPSKRECPDIVYIRAPDLNFCGVDRNGNKQGFARPCQVCIDRNYGFYYEAPCSQVPDIICKDFEFCNNGKCLDRCATIKCSAGFQCKKGQCVPVSDPCDRIRCRDNQKCQNGVCVQNDIDQCKKKCKSYEICFNGQCRDKCDFLKCANCYKGQCGVFPLPECQRDFQCGYGNICDKGKCIDKCALIKCRNGYQCKMGYCFPIFKDNK